MKEESVIGRAINGEPFLLDKMDADLLGFRWSCSIHRRTKYLMGTTKPYTWKLMHRIILMRQNPALLNPFEVDHINGCGFDNRRSNLRIVNRSQNNANQSKRQCASSKFKGVSWDSDQNRWISQIQINGKYRFLGRFDVEEDAARAYNEAALNGFGKFSRLNLL